MSKKVVFVIAFLIGAATGSVATYCVYRSKSEKEKDDFYENEVKPARDEYLKKTKEIIESNRSLKEKMLDTYDNLTENLGYVVDEAEEKAEEVKEQVSSSFSAASELIESVKNDILEPLTQEPEIYFIEPNTPMGEYPEASLVHYTNNVLVDENYNVVDGEELLGKDICEQLIKLHEMHTDIVYVRNDKLSTDFEIQLADYDFND